MLKRIPFIGTLALRFSKKALLDSVQKNISGSGNRVLHGGAILKDVQIQIDGDHNLIQIGERVIMQGVSISVKGNHHVIRIAEDCRFAAGCEIVVEDANCLVEIGAKCTFEQVHIAVTEQGSILQMGEDCMVAANVEIRTGDSHGIYAKDSGERINPAQNISIGDHVWIASHALVLKGSVLPANSVVGAGTVLTKKWEGEGLVLAGNPGRIIRNGVYWTRNRT